MTEVEIANLALSHLKASAIVSFEQANSKAARVMKQHYPVVRDSLLRAFQWNFAMSWIEPAQTTAPVSVWAHAYALDGDVLRVVEVANLDQNQWEVEAERTLVCDQPAPVSVRVVKQTTNPNRYDAMFVEMFGYALAAAAGAGLTRRRTTVQDARAQYNRLAAQARRIDSYERRHRDDEYVPEAIRARSV